MTSAQTEVALHLASVLMDGILEGTYDSRASAPLRGGSSVEVTPDNLYDGTAGVVLCLAELCRNGFEAKYRPALLRGLQIVAESCSQAPQDWSYVTGRTGALALLRDTRDLLGSDELLRTALAQTGAFSQMIEFRSCDLLGGAAGGLLGGLQLLDGSDEWVPELIARSYVRLVEDARPTPLGYVWCREKLRVHPLCGLAHGASGIALALLELFAATRSPDVAWLAEQPLAYEAAHFDVGLGNWPDFRVHLGDRDALDRATAELPSEWSRWTRGADFVAWCHGAPGIGWTRKRAIEILGAEGRPEDLTRAIHRTRAWVEAHTLRSGPLQMSLSLCHGLAGNLAFLIDGGDSPRDPVIEIAMNVLFEAVGTYGPEGSFARRFTQPELGKDGLFSGVAGVAYFLSRFASSAPASVLMPSSPHRDPDLAERIRGVSARARLEARQERFALPRAPVARLRSEALAILRQRRARQSCREWLAEHASLPAEARLLTDPALVMLEGGATEQPTQALRPGLGGMQPVALPPIEASLVRFGRRDQSVTACLDHLAQCSPEATAGATSSRLRRTIDAALLAPVSVWQELAHISLFDQGSP